MMTMALIAVRSVRRGVHLARAAAHGGALIAGPVTGYMEEYVLRAFGESLNGLAKPYNIYGI